MRSLCTPRSLLSVLLLALLALPVRAEEGLRVYTPKEVPNVQVEDYRRFVSDPEGYFTSEERAEIDRALFDLREKHTVEAVLVVLPAIEGDDPESFTEALFRLWGIGKAKDDNGLLILYVTERGRLIRFETGYGLEGVLPDIITYQISQETLIPGILEGHAAEAFLAGIDQIDGYLTDGYLPDNGGNVDYPGEGDAEDLRDILTGYLVFSFLAGLFFLMVFLGSVRRARTPAKKVELIERYAAAAVCVVIVALPSIIMILPCYLHQKRKWRKRLVDCPYCGSKGTVSRLSYPANLPHLTIPQALEEQLRSVSHPVLLCSYCGETQVMSKDRGSKVYQVCPQCGTKAYHKVRADRSMFGRQQTTTYKCDYCGHEGRSNSFRDNGGGPIIWGGGIGGGFGSGGGGFGGGSFGGGASGGGGSTSSF